MNTCQAPCRVKHPLEGNEGCKQGKSKIVNKEFYNLNIK